MRQNPSFAMTDVAELRRVIADSPLATLGGRDGEGMTASHYAVLLDPDRDDLTVAAVPTWNYVAVYLAGTPELLSTEENLRILEHLVAHFEESRPQPRGMWAPPNEEAFVRRLEAGTVGFRLTPTRVTAKRKLSQNKPNPALAAEMRRAHDAHLATHDAAATGRGDGARS